jgi:hypothetical protein
VTAAEAHVLIAAALATWFSERPIAGDVVPPATAGHIYVNMIEAAIKSAMPTKITSVAVTLPAGTTVLGVTQVPMLGTVTATIPFHFIPDP